MSKIAIALLTSLSPEANFTLEFVTRRARRKAAPLLALSALLVSPVFAHAQITYGGSSANQSFGSVAVGATSAARAFTFSIPAGTTVGSIAIFTLGVPNLDLASASGSNCMAISYLSAETCTINVTFTPKYPGLRRGAVVFFSGANNTGAQLANVPVYGVGLGHLTSHQLSTGMTVDLAANGNLVDDPWALRLDGAGNLFVADFPNHRVIESLADGSGQIAIAPTVNGIPLNGPQAIALDGAGDLFIADTWTRRVIEVPAGGGPASAVSPSVDGNELGNDLEGLVVDGAGDQFSAYAAMPLSLAVHIESTPVYSPVQRL